MKKSCLRCGSFNVKLYGHTFSGYQRFKCRRCNYTYTFHNHKNKRHREKEHAKVFFKHLEGGDVEIIASYPAGVIADTKSNLEAAAAGEHMEWTAIYSDFAKIAADEGFPEVARSFEQVAKVEKFHESRYQKLIRNISNGEVFKKKTPVKWHCINCGYVLEGTEAPKECPACRHPQSYYEMLAENY